MDDDRVVGTIGRVTVPIPAHGPGEVVVSIRGGSEAFAAWSDTTIAKNTQVLVIEQTSPRSVIVTPFVTTPSLLQES